MSTPGLVARLGSLFYEDASLTQGVQWLIDKHLRSLEGKEWADELGRAAIQVLADGLLPDDYEVSEVDSDGLWVIHRGHRFPLREMSDGYRSIAALVVDLIKQVHDCYGDLHSEVREGVPVVTAPGVVIIDEVDAHLHVSWQRQIGTWLKAHFPNIQFIVTTHSPYICQAADPGGLIRLAGPDKDEPPRVVDQALYERVVCGSGGDAVPSEPFGLLNCSVCVIGCVQIADDGGGFSLSLGFGDCCLGRSVSLGFSPCLDLRLVLAEGLQLAESLKHVGPQRLSQHGHLGDLCEHLVT